MAWTFVQHVHTRRSFDCLSDPLALARRAEEVGIEVLAVTDHDSWQGSVDVRAAAAAEGLELRVVLGTEVHTDQGDVIGLFIQSDLREHGALKFCDAVHAQGGLVVLPHPYKWHRLDDALLQRVDLIEVYNPRVLHDDNTRARDLAEERKLPMLVGSDAHRVSELMLARTEFAGETPNSDEEIKKALLHGERRFFTEPGTIWDEWMSQAAKFLKRPGLGQAVLLARGALGRVISPEAYVAGVRPPQTTDATSKIEPP